MARTFVISDEQEQQFVTWKQKHEMTCPAKPDFSMALYSIVFTPSGLGDDVTVKCPCGAKKFLDAGEPKF